MQVRDLSTGGCLLETRAFLPVGTVGVLDMEIEGKRCVEWFRIRRTQATHGRSGAYLFGAEFLLPIAVAGDSSLRGAVRRVYRVDRVSRPAGRMSGEPGNSMVSGAAIQWSTDGLPADSARQVLEFRRPDDLDGFGSQVAESEGADAPGNTTSDTADTSMKQVIVRFVREDEGQDLVEYVLLGATVAFAGLVAMNAFDDVINRVYTSWESGAQAVWEPQDPQP